MEPAFFATPADFRAWLERHHGEAAELLVGFYKKRSGRPTMSWPESVDQALCFGWIDGVRRGRDAESYTIRFTPRKPRSIWSAVNIAKYAKLVEQGAVAPAGVAAYERRTEKRSRVYAFEQQQEPELSAEQERRFRERAGAWEFFLDQAPSYRRTVVWWIVSAKREQTRAARLGRAIEDSANGQRIAQFSRWRSSAGPGVAKE